MLNSAAITPVFSVTLIHQEQWWKTIGLHSASVHLIQKSKKNPGRHHVLSFSYLVLGEVVDSSTVGIRDLSGHTALVHIKHLDGAVSASSQDDI